MSDAFSAIIIVDEYVFADGMFGMTDASTTRMRCNPCTLNWSSTTEVLSLAGPIRAVPIRWYDVEPYCRA